MDLVPPEFGPVARAVPPGAHRRMNDGKLIECCRKVDNPLPDHHDLLVAKTIITKITDDLDGSQDASAVTFSFDGVDYTIDLSKKNADAMAKALKPYLEAATKVGSRSGSRRGNGSSSSSTRAEYAQIREWARKQGLDVSERGRIPGVVVDQYRAAH